MLPFFSMGICWEIKLKRFRLPKKSHCTKNEIFLLRISLVNGKKHVDNLWVCSHLLKNLKCKNLTFCTGGNFLWKIWRKANKCKYNTKQNWFLRRRLKKVHPEELFCWIIRIRIYNPVLYTESMGQGKPVSWHILHSGSGMKWANLINDQ